MIEIDIFEGFLWISKKTLGDDTISELLMICKNNNCVVCTGRALMRVYGTATQLYHCLYDISCVYHIHVL